jgi:cell division septation protein DedD
MKAKSFVPFILLLVLLSSFLVFTANAEATPVMKFSPTDIQLSEPQIGSELQVNVTVENVNNLWQWATAVIWDPAVLNLTRVEEGEFLKSLGSGTLFPPLPNIQPGLIPEMSCTVLAPSTANGSGVLAKLTFKILSVQQSTIKLNQTQLYNPATVLPNGTIQNFPISHTKMDAQITVVQPSPSPTPSATAEPSPTPTPTAEPSPTAAATPSPTPTTPANAEPEPELTTVYAIVIAGAVMAGLVAIAVMTRRK